MADIIYISTQEGWLCLAIMLDLFSLGVIDWPIDRQVTGQLVIDVLNIATKNGYLGSGLIHNSDLGV